MKNALGASSMATAKQQADTQQAVGESSVAVNKTTAAKQVADTQKALADTEKSRSEKRKIDIESGLRKREDAKAETYEKAFRKPTLLSTP